MNATQKKFENIIIASDMDGTFLDSDSNPVPRNLEAIRYFIREGGHFTFATGRDHCQLLHAVPMATEIVNLPIIACNGASLYDLTEDREVKAYVMDHEVIEELCSLLTGDFATVALRFGTDRELLYDKMSNPYIERDMSYNLTSRLIRPGEWRNHPIYKIAVRGEPTLVGPFRAMIGERFAGRLEITQSAPSLLDIQTAGRTKAALLSELVASFDRKMTLCAVGDYDNDLEMLSIADIPACPDNAVPAVKAICKYCLCNHKQGAIADLVEILDKTVTL